MRESDLIEFINRTNRAYATMSSRIASLESELSLYRGTAEEAERMAYEETTRRSVIDLPYSRSACVDGVWFHNLRTDASKPYIYCDRAIPSAYESATPPPVVGGQEVNYVNIEIFRKWRSFGDIHVDGL